MSDIKQFVDVKVFEFNKLKCVNAFLHANFLIEKQNFILIDTTIYLRFADHVGDGQLLGIQTARIDRWATRAYYFQLGYELDSTLEGN